MRVFIALVLLFLCLLLLDGASAQSRGWRGIVPLQSTRTDVERTLGTPTERSNPYTDFYRTPKETVLITYSTGLPCGIGQKYSQWRVPAYTVEAIFVTPTQPLRFSDLGIDQSKYEKRQGGHRIEDVYYVNKQTGESLRVFMDEIQNLEYFPGTLDEALKCPGLPIRPDTKCEGFAPPTFKTYRNVTIETEKALLDNFSIALKDEPTRTGYIIAYAGTRARAGEAQARAERAKNYLLKARGFYPDRIKVMDGGYREEAQVDLFVVPEGSCPPAVTPTVDPRDVRIIQAAGRRR